MPIPIEAIGRDNVRYFGVWGDDSNLHRHALWAPGRLRTHYERTPWDGKLDMGLCPAGNLVMPRLKPKPVDQVQGVSKIHHRKGWTAWAFWDRTGDARFHSNSVFLAYGRHDFDTMRRIAAHYFPEIWDRVKDLHFRLEGP